jgi:hypothetical protein
MISVFSSATPLIVDAAKIKKSDFRCHQKLELVDKEYEDIIEELCSIYA